MIIVWLHILTQVSYVTLSTLTPRPKNTLLVLFCLVQISECDYLLSGGYFRDIWRYKKKPVRGKFGKGRGKIVHPIPNQENSKLGLKFIEV